MFEEYKYKTELHAHTSPASYCSQITPERMVEAYLKMGYSSVVITNHLMREFDTSAEEFLARYKNDYRKAKVLGEREGLNIILGAEIRFTENVNDYLLYGIEEDELEKIFDLLDNGVDNFYKVYKNDRNVLFQAHPFRDNMSRANPESIDGIEVFNLHPGHNSRVGIAAQYAREHKLLICGGTDFHHEGHQGMCAIATKDKIKDSVQLAQILKNRDFVLDVGGFKILPY